MNHPTFLLGQKCGMVHFNHTLLACYRNRCFHIRMDGTVVGKRPGGRKGGHKGLILCEVAGAASERS